MNGVQQVILNIEGLNEIGSQLDESPEAESYNQFIGVQAAKRLDQQEGTTIRMDNYKVARIMERAGKHPHNIWLATGWGRGVDSKWRMELMDGKLIKNKRRQYKALKREADTLLKKANYNPNDKTIDESLLSYDERKRLSDISIALLDNTLGNILDAPELFDAYPQLKNVWIEEKDLIDKNGNVYDGVVIDNFYIQINQNLKADDYYSTLLHEIQHIIQNFEGFAHGSNEEMFKKYADSNGLVDANPFLEKAFKRRAEAIYRTVSPKIRKIFASLRKQQANMTVNEFDALINSSLSRKDAQTFREFNEQANVADMFSNGEIQSNMTSPYYIYRSSAGEVESRNVQRRKNMTITERRLNPPDLTEDRDRLHETKKGDQFIVGKRGKPLSEKKTYDREAESESYNQIIGEIGAAAIDDEEGTTWRIDNLDVAKQMTKKGLSPDKIKAATNWELGADSKWKFEILDGKIIPDAFTEFVDEYEANEDSNVWLSEIFDAPELYTAYPEIAETPVYIKKLRGGTAMKLEDGRIFISTKILNYPLGDIQSALLHEIQHNIQDIEGFAIGTATSEKAHTLRKHIIDTIENSKSNYKKQLYDVVGALENKNVEIAKKIIDTLPLKEKPFCLNVVKATYQYLKEIKPYNDNAGENEARNVQRREHMTLEERRNHTLESTEDTPRNIQIVQFDDDTESYNQIIGEKGAKAIDEANGNTDLIDNLNVAKQMTKAGKDKKTIRLATGWELGIDDEWKYDIPDGDVYPDFINNGKLNGNPDKHYKLSEVFDDNLLFNAYPEIKNYRVTLSDILDSNGQSPAYFMPDEKRFVFAIGIPDYKVRSAFIHEIQHAIQYIEGFGLPISSARAQTDLTDNNGEINFGNLTWNRFQKKADDIWDSLSGYEKDNWEQLENDIDNYFNGDYRFVDDIKELMRDEYNMDDNEQNLFLLWADAKQKAQEGEHYGEIITPFETYWRSSGEVESRNSEKRQKLSDDERRNTLLEDTEDVERDKQIVRKIDDKGYESYFQIGPKRKIDMDNALAKSRPDLTQKQRADAISEIEKLGESVRQGGYPKVEKLATHWLLHGHVVLPEDNYKIIDAIRISEQHHLDPMRFDDPNEILAKFTIKESNAEKLINPDSVKEFKHKVRHDNGITVYNVDDSQEGQAAVRNIIDSHWGKDANPWCLAARYKDDEDSEDFDYGELDRAWSFWNQYDGIPKRIAFRNGKLIAFSANHDKRIAWWDREDNPMEAIPYTVKENGNIFEYAYNELTRKSAKIKETLRNGTIHQWFDNGDPRFEKLPDGTERRYYGNGQVLSEVLPDGSKRLWFLDEKIENPYSHDGSLLWDKKGSQLQRETLPDGTDRQWYKNGQLQREILPDRTQREWYESGQLQYEKLDDGTQRKFYENGNIKAEELPDGTFRTFDENGQLKREIVPLGTRRNIETYNQPFLRARKQNETSYHIDEHKFVLHINDSSIPQQQLDDVKRQYQGTSQWLKAPNGKKSKLNERQWLQVRTPNFKKWFGDREHDPEHASKVLDENGEPLVVYHGRANPNNFLKPFSVFNTKGMPPNQNTGAWFTSSLSLATEYARAFYYNGDNLNIYPVFLNIRNPYIINGNGQTWDNINGKKTHQIVREVWNGKLGNKNHDGVIFKDIRDPNILSDVFVVPTPENIKSATKNNGEFNPDNPDIYHQAAYNPKETIKNLLKGITSTARNIFSSSPANNQNTQNLRFENDETEKRYIEGKKGVQKEGIVQKIKNHTLGLLKSLRGDFPELSGNEAARKGLLFAKEQFRLLHRRRFATVHEAMSSFTRNLRGLSDTQKDLFARKRLLDDLLWRKQNNPDAELPFGFDSDMLEREYKRFSDLVRQDKKVADAIKAEEETMQKISDEFIKLAGQLGVNLEDALRNPHYYRHTILEYANAAALGLDNKKFRYNDASLQQLVDSELRKITRRDYLKKFKGSPLDINTNYIQANGEVRAQMLTDIQVMNTLLEIKKKYDIAPKLREQLKKVFSETQNQSNSEILSQSDDDSTLSDILPDGYTLWDPAGSRLISSANSTSENILSMAIDDASEQSGLPIDRIFSFLGDFGENALNRLCVIPNEVAEALSRMGKKRDRGMLGDAARTLTDWWKKIVLFSPTRNLKYNFRNFTGDLDAVISGNPKALRFFGRAVKELTDYYRNRNTTQDLQDYIERSGGMRIESLNMDNEGLKKIQNVAEKISPSWNLDFQNLPADSWNLIKDFFAREQNFTAWREHLLRYAAYLSYKQDMDSNNGTPLTWGASVPDEVMSVDDVRDRAYKMSNELLGAYDQISETGKQLRDMLIPFWSWQEVNLKRYYRLIQNGLAGRNPSGLAKRLLLAKSARIPFYAIAAADTFGKIALLTLITQMFNRFVMGDDDDDLPPDVKYKPHITLGKVDGQVYYFDRIGALGDAADWLALDSLFIDAKELRNGQLSMTDYMKKIITAPVGKFLNSVNPFFRLPYEVMLGRSLFPDPSRPTNIQDSKKYIAQAFGLSWPYKAITGEPHSNWDEFKNLFVYGIDADEAAYFYALDKVKEFQERVLGKSFNGFATSKRGQVLRKLKTALRLHDNLTVRECIREYEKLAGKKKDGSKNTQGLKTSMKSMNPLFGLSDDEQKKFMRWLDNDDKIYLRRADKYFHRLADKYIR